MITLSRLAAFSAVLLLTLPAQAQETVASPPAATPPVATATITMPSFENMAEKLLPTVVNVSTTTKLARSEQPGLQMPQLPPGSPFEKFFKDFYDQYNKGQDGEMPGMPQGPREDQDGDKVSALGSGFIIDAANGYIVTNNHVIKDADEIKVILHDDTSLDATLVGTDEKTDIALLKVKLPATNNNAYATAKWGDSDQSKVGSWVLAIGNPFGLGGTVTAGIVSARQRNINAGPYDDFIQTDASINRGNSGGPMFNTKGEVIGVNTAIFSPTGGSVGIGFAVPSNLAKNVVEQLVKYGKTKRGWLGVRIQEVTPEIAASLKLDRARGALVSSVTAKSPSEIAGIEAGDVILSFEGKEITKMSQLPRLVADTEVGKKSSVVIWRKGAEKTVTVDLGQLEKAEEEALGDAPTKKKGDAVTSAKAEEIKSLGLSLAVIDKRARDTYGIAETLKGLVVTDVTRGSPAAEKGIIPGDVITEVDQQEVTSVADVTARVEAAQKAGREAVLFFLARKEERRFVALKPKKD